MEFVDNSEQAKERLEILTIKALTQACLLVQGQAIALAPVDTSNLKNSIDYRVDRRELMGYVGTNTEYAVYVEFGTGEFAEKGNGRKGGWVYQTPNGKWYFTYGNKPKPYLRPAFRRNRKQIQAIMEQVLSEMGGK